MNETEQIKLRFEERKKNEKLQKKYSTSPFTKNIVEEREKIYSKILHRKFSDFLNLKMLEVGAGSGGNINFFLNLGIKNKNIFANELLDDRVQSLKANHSDINIFPGNALDLNFSNEFDIIFQSTVFTSILNDGFRKKFAEKMWDMLKEGGIILWYDFIFSNPQNKDVKKVTAHEIRILFSKAKSINFYPTTLAPPIGRKIGNLYKIINSIFPFLRTHVVAEIHK